MRELERGTLSAFGVRNNSGGVQPISAIEWLDLDISIRLDVDPDTD